MKFVVQKGVFLKALQNVSGAVDSRSGVAFLNCVKIVVDNAKVSLVATNLDVEASDVLVADVKSEGSIAVPVATVVDIVKTLSSDIPVTFEVVESSDIDRKAVVITSGRSKFEVGALVTDDFPRVFGDDFDEEISITSKAFSKAISKTAFSMCSDPGRYNMNGLLIHSAMHSSGKNMLRTVSTDGHRLSMFDIELESSVVIPEMVLPRRSVNEIARLLAGKDADVKIMFSSNKIGFAFGDILFVTKLVDCKFPEYKDAIPKGNDKIMKCDRVSLINVLDRVDAIYRFNGTRGVKVSINSSLLVLNACNKQGDVVSDELEVEFSDTDVFNSSYNPRFISDVLSVMSSSSVRFSFSSSGAAIIINSTDDDFECYVVMPMARSN